MNVRTLAPANATGTTETGPRVAARGVITRRNGHQTVVIVGEEGGLGRSTPLVAKGDTRRQAEARIAAAGGAR